MNWISLVEPLVEAQGISGDEGQVAKAITALLPEGCTAVSDAMGNLLVSRGNPKEAAQLMICAHMDEPGLLVRSVGEKGQIYFTATGPVDSRVLPGRQVTILRDGKAIPGVIGVKPVHVSSQKERETPVKKDKMYIDIGCDTDSQVKELVEPGDSVAFSGGVSLFGQQLLRGRALCSRSGCALLLELLRQEPELPFTAVFTAQRLSGGAGMTTAAFQVQPQRAIVLDSAPSAFSAGEDVPALGKGPVLSLRERRVFFDRELYRIAANIAKALEVPVQRYTDPNGSSDAVGVYLSGAGCPVLALGIPTRNPGTTCEIQSLEDLENSFRLLKGLAQELCR